MHRVVFALTAIALMAGTRLTHADSPATERGGVASLEDRLKNGLRVKAPRDLRFVETVAERVREGRMPAKVVDSTYFWAVSRGKKYPFPAFEHSIRIQAAKLGVPLE
jgi:hypothetical protein